MGWTEADGDALIRQPSDEQAGEDASSGFDGSHDAMRRLRFQLTLRVTIYAEAVGALTDKIHSLESYESAKTVHSDETAAVANAPVTTARSHVVGAPGRIRTCAFASGGRRSIP